MAEVSARPRDTTLADNAPRAVDNTDWLKAAAIIFVLVDHFGHFFMDDDHWWAAFGRLAAPSFFFLMGYARTRIVPLHWIWLGVVLTLLDGWNAGWRWVEPNILLSLAFIRLVHPYVEALVQRYGWIAFAFMVCGLVAVLPMAAKCVDYGSEGWLWALFGLYQRRYVDRQPRGDFAAASLPRSIPHSGMMRLLACVIAALVYVWQEQKEFSFPHIQLAVFVAGLCVLSLWLLFFRRGASGIQPPRPVACILHFIGRHTLEIYAVQLAGSELAVNLLPGLAP